VAAVFHDEAVEVDYCSGVEGACKDDEKVVHEGDVVAA
jgi:hypothetical protein